MSLTIWLCLLGMIQPALACAPVPDGCCPQGTPARGIEHATIPAASATDDCCCARQVLTSSVRVAAQPRKAPDQSSSPPASPGAPAGALIAQLPNEAAPLAHADYRGNESLTYLRTARLRL
jgi:hypothetical protein